MKNGINSRVYEKLFQIAGGIMSPAIEDWKKQGGRVMGYFCSWVPEELFIAAGILPFRIRGTGSTGTERADEYFTSCNCSFPRHCFNTALSGGYDFLDGVVIGTSCDAIRHVFDNWKNSPLKTPFVYQLNRPDLSGEIMAAYFREELVKMNAAIENHFGVKITDEQLWKAIKLCNETRQLQQQLYDLRKAPNPSISGSEVAAVMVAGASMPKEQYNRDLAVLLNELPGSKPDDNSHSARLMIVGACGDDPIICEIAEQQGAVVVNDQTCFGGVVKYKGVSETGGDPLAAIARYQIIDRPFCAKIGGAHPLRTSVILDIGRDFKVDGIIGQRLGCCDAWGGEVFALREDFKQAGTPCLMIEREYIPDSRGQLTTRVQAFLETIQR